MPIVPDTKDWTWVLERSCGECGFDPEQFHRSLTASAIRENAVAWALILKRDDVMVRASDDRWSDLEYACHVRDVYRIFDQRLAAMLAEDSPMFENWDQDASAVLDRYDLQDPGVVSRELLLAAENYADRFDSVRKIEWTRPGTRSNGSHFTVETLAIYGLHDCSHHVWDVTSTR
jgi:hypothetical protein